MFPYICRVYETSARLRHRQLAAVGQMVQMMFALRQAAALPGHLFPGALARPQAREVLPVHSDGAEGGRAGCQCLNGLRS